MRKLVLFDIDGTLVSYSTNPGHIPEPTREAVRLLMERGHVVAVATGRSILTTREVMVELGIVHGVLCGGAHVISRGRTILVRHLEQSLAETVAARSVELGCAVIACAEQVIYLGNGSPDSWSYVREQAGRHDAAQPIERLERVCQMNIYGDELPEQELLGDASLTRAPRIIEMKPAGVTKASGMECLAQLLGIGIQDTVAVGDSENDTEILAAAGIGIAVGNAVEAAKAAADIVCDPIDDGGILTVMKQLGLI